MSAHLKNALRTGVVFGIVMIFLVLIGFNLIAGQMIGNLMGNVLPLSINMLVFFGLIALWNGSRGAQKTETDRWNEALSGSILAGAACGFLVAVLAYLLGTLNNSGVRINFYLAELLPNVIDQFILSLNPLTAAIIYFIFFTLFSLIGGMLARAARQSHIRDRLSRTSTKTSQNFFSLPFIQTIRVNRIARYAFYALILAIVFLLPFVIGQYWNYTLGTVGIYVLLGLGLNIVVGLAGLLDLGYVAFFAIGAYTVALLTAPAPHHLMWSFWVALPLGIILAALAGVLLGIPVLRMRGDYLAIVTLGFGEIIRILSSSDALSSFSGGPRGVPAVGYPTLFGAPLNSDVDFVVLIILAVFLIIFVTRRLQNSRVGRAWIAMREDDTVARAMGINTLQYKLLAFAIGAAFAGLGGVLFASRNQFTGPEDFVLMVSINVLCVVIVGGMGSIPGIIAGAFVLKGLPEVLRQLQDYRVVAFGALLVVMMIIRPEGLIPSRRRQMEMHEEAELEPPQPVHPESTDVIATTGEKT